MGKFVACTITLVFLAVPSSALNASGRLTSSLYAFEGLQADSTTTSYGRAYQSLRLQLSDMGTAALSFHTYVQGTTDLAEEADNDQIGRAHV